MCDEMRGFPRFCLSVLITGNASPDGGVGRERADDSQATEYPNKGKEYIAKPNMTVVVQEAMRDVRVVVGNSVKSGCYPGGKPTTRWEAIANAGGFWEFARVNKEDVLGRVGDGSQSLLALNYKQVIQERSLSQNVELKSMNKGCSSKEKLSASISLVVYVMLLPVGLEAQTAAPAPTQPSVYGSGAQTPLRYAGEAAPGNQLALSMGASPFYDDNVFQRNSQRVGDEAVSLDSHLTLTRQTENLTISFDYLPYFLLYRQATQFDRLNHTADLNLTYRLGSHFNLGLHGTFSYQNGVLQSLTGQQIMSGLGSPTTLNQTILPYTVRTLSNSSGLDLTYVKSHRTSLTLTGGYNQQKFGSQVVAGQPLYNSTGVSGGFQYQYLVTEHTSFGLLLLHEDSTFKGGEVFGNHLRFQMENAVLSVGSRLAPTVTVTLFGGAQYVRIIGQSAVGIAGQFQPAGGGTITKEVRKTALDLSVQTSVSGGGGLYTLTKSTTASFGVRRRLVGRWEASLQGGAARADTSLLQFASGRTDALTGAFGLFRPLSSGATLRVSYGTMHQLSKGTLPISSSFDHNQVTIGVSYRLKAIPLGR
jgi:hypothetical protein